MLVVALTQKQRADAAETGDDNDADGENNNSEVERVHPDPPGLQFGPAV